MTSARNPLDILLTKLSEEINVPETKYDEARTHYAAVGSWLDADGSALHPYGISIYAQGSFALGTAVKPPEDCDYDVDAVCLIQRPPGWTQEELKEAVGHRLKQHARYREMLQPPEGGRRCWTLQYAEEARFHLDVLPAKPDDPRWLITLGVPNRYAGTAIEITSRDRFDDPIWPKSNPKGYLQSRDRSHLVL